MSKPPYYFSLTSALNGKEEGKTLEESNSEMCERRARALRNTILVDNRDRLTWRLFIADHPNDPAAIFMAEVL